MLSDARARKMKAGDKPISDPAVTGLYLFTSSTPGAGKWIFRFLSPLTRKRRDMGLGRYPAIAIRDARAKALEARAAVEAGQDPLNVRQEREEEEARRVRVPTFEEAARKHHTDRAEGFRNGKHADQWINTLERYVFPKIGERVVTTLGPADFATCLKPIWIDKAETAARVKQRCDAVMDWCAASGYIVASPARVVDKLLPRQPGKRERVIHQPAVPWPSLPSLFRDHLYSGAQSISRTMLELLILTATRSGEIRQMQWDEIEFEEAIWTIPASRMKAKIMHRVPLGPRSIELLQRQLEKSEKGRGLVFPSRAGTPVSGTLPSSARRW